MAALDNPLTICVTGAGGYVASWIVHDLLLLGHNVHACVRSLKSASHINKVDLGIKNARGDLKVFEGCDLLKEGSFDQAMEGCSVVIHTASPFIAFGARDDPMKKLVEPALFGTENVLNTVNRTESVTRVVLTASVVSIMSSYKKRAKDQAPFTENDWNDYDTVQNDPYPYSKAVSEKKAWEICKAQSRWSMVTIHPGLVLGPLLGGRSNDGSVAFMKKMLNGVLNVGLNIQFPSVDVRDISKAHIMAIFNGSGRYLCVENSYWVKDLIKELEDVTAQKYKAHYQFTAPDVVGAILGPYVDSELTRPFLATNLSTPLRFSTEKIQKDFTGFSFISIRQSMKDMVESMESFGLI